MATATLQEVLTKFVERTTELTRGADPPIPTHAPYNVSCPPVHDAAHEILVVRLQTLWGEFSREILYLSCQGGVMTVGGISLQPTPKASELGSAKAALNETSKRIRVEMGRVNPPWHDPEFIVRVAQGLELENAARFEELTGTPPVPRYVTSFRNYIVHRHDRNLPDYQYVAAAYGNPLAKPAQLLRTGRTGGITLFDEWVRTLQVRAERASM